MNENKISRKFGVLPGDRVSLIKKSYDSKAFNKVTGVVTEVHPKLWWIRIFYPKYGYYECFTPASAIEHELRPI